MPSRWWLTTNYLPSVGQKCMERVKAMLMTSGYHHAISSDTWTSRYGAAFQSITARSLVKRPDLTPQRQIIEHKLDVTPVTSQHTAPVILAHINELCSKWGIGPIQSGDDLEEVLIPVFATSDRGTNIKKALQESSSYMNVPCIAHVIHRVVLSSIAKNEKIRDILINVTNISRNLHKSSQQSTHFRNWVWHSKARVPPAAITPIQTRWYSAVESLGRYLELH